MKTSVIVALFGIGIVLASAPATTAQEPLKPPAGRATPEQMFAPGKPAMFQPIAIDPALMDQIKHSRSEYENLKQKIMARQAKLYADNATIKDLQAKMRDSQKKIDKILADDEELKKLNEQFQSVSPNMPSGLKKAPPMAFAPPNTPAPVADKKPEVAR
ncbi:MAG: hypothetical protein KKE37_00965 [Verrucomicrobia bacterium]|nr:hypothetical protein [Verrucomicrobiota bacterium]MBU4292017.1 hypothetical protein [Verrucomicrobiota bacterium]MBU4427905.1 hypothetical protein [Verrucomicrobiota bacterium]MCG2678851.1 hypothetical protein [Kiritimatiellia bacterium]